MSGFPSVATNPVFTRQIYVAGSLGLHCIDGPGVSALGNNRNLRPLGPAAANAVAVEEARAAERRKLRYRMLAALSKINFKNGLKSSMNTCGQFAAYTKGKDDQGFQKRHETIDVVARHDPETGRTVVHQSHVGKCGRPMICPVCGAQILAKRRAEMQQIMHEMLLTHGYNMMMITFTARHDFKTKLDEFIKQFTAARDMLFADKSFKNQCARLGKKHHMFATEVTLDNMVAVRDREVKPTGWHYHLHYIMFYKCKDEKILFEFEHGYEKTDERGRRSWIKGLKDTWVHCLKAKGLDGEVQYASDVILMDKQLSVTDNIQKATEYMCKDVAFEASGAAYKSGRKSTRMSIRDLQITCAFRWDRLSEKDYKYYCGKWIEYVKAIAKKPCIYFTAGLKAMCGVVEKSDQEIVEDGTAGDVILHSYKCEQKGSSDWRYIARQGGQGYLLQEILFQINNDAKMQEFVKSISEAETKEEKRKVKPPELVRKIRIFARMCADLALQGYDVEPYEVDEQGRNIHMYIDADFRLASCRCNSDTRLPNIQAGVLLRDAKKWAQPAKAAPGIAA